MSAPLALACAWALLVVVRLEPWRRAARPLTPHAITVPARRSWRRVRRSPRVARRRASVAVVVELPEVIDLFVLAVGAGLNVALAVASVASRSPPLLGAALHDALARAAQGERLADALARMPDQVGEPVRPLAAALVASERYGVPLLPTLERLVVEARADRRRKAEVAARRVPVLLLFPLVLCVLPAFCLLTLVPLLAGTLGSAGLP